MSLIDLRPMWSTEEAGSQTDGRNSSRSSTRSWTATSNDQINDTAESILLESGLREGQSLPGDAFRRIRSLRCLRLSPVLYRIDASFTAEGKQSGDNPLSQFPVIEFDFAVSDEAIDTDINGQPIQTDCKERFDPPLTAEISDLVITVTRNQQTFDPLLAATYHGAVNSDSFQGFQPGVCRITGIRASSVEFEGFVYFTASTTVQVRRVPANVSPSRAWWKRVVHQGYRVKNGLTGLIEHARERDEDNNAISDTRVSTPVMLKPGGEQELDETKTHWKEFQVYPSLPFSGLGIF